MSTIRINCYRPMVVKRRCPVWAGIKYWSLVIPPKRIVLQDEKYIHTSCHSDNCLYRACFIFQNTNISIYRWCQSRLLISLCSFINSISPVTCPNTLLYHIACSCTVDLRFVMARFVSLVIVCLVNVVKIYVYRHIWNNNRKQFIWNGPIIWCLYFLCVWRKNKHVYKSNHS